MFLFKRGGNIIANTGQTFRDFLQSGFQGHVATMNDWRLHLATLFPEVRLKNTLELRSCDAQPNETLMAVPALGVGILYDELALEQAESLAEKYDFESLVQARPALIHRGYEANLAGHSLGELAESLVEIAQGGLNRRARLNANGDDESIYLAPLARLVEQRKTPSALVRERLERAATLDVTAMVEATRII
jgi:glutamate--cysteine ligase